MQPIPPPGLAIFPQYLSSTQLKVILKGETFSKSMTATLDDGTLLFNITGESLSASHRRAVMDAKTSSKLFEVRKESWGAKHYYAEASDGGPRLFQMDTQTRVFHRAMTTISFANQADASNGSPRAELDVSPKGIGKDGTLTLNGKPVVLIEKKSFSRSGEYHLAIAPGLDPALVVGVMVAMIDQSYTKSSSGAAGGAAAGAAAGGGGGGGC